MHMYAQLMKTQKGQNFLENITWSEFGRTQHTSRTEKDYLTIIPRVRVRYEMVDTQRGA